MGHSFCVRPQGWWSWIQCECGPCGWHTDLSARYLWRCRWFWLGLSPELSYRMNILSIILKNCARRHCWLLLQILFITDPSNSSLGAVEVPEVGLGEGDISPYSMFIVSSSIEEYTGPSKLTGGGNGAAQRLENHSEMSSRWWVSCWRRWIQRRGVGRPPWLRHCFLSDIGV